MPDEHNHRTETTPSPQSPEPAGGGPSLTPEATASASTDGAESATEPEQPSTKVAPRLITAVEIENFKGIGRPMRIDLRPVTLLFGNNSAGKSTVLHALCYAHEILSHRDVDAHKTQLGGDRIDLGGFRNFVHAHDPTRTVRLSFELNLEGWQIPHELHGALRVAEWSDEIPSTASNIMALKPTSGWVELQIERHGDRPVLSSYEVGVNEAIVGRLFAGRQADATLVLNVAHPLLWHVAETSQSPLRTGDDDWARHRAMTRVLVEAGAAEQESAPPEATGAAVFVREFARRFGLQFSRVRGLTSALPHWGHLLTLDELPDIRHEGLLAALLVGIGQTLRDELARIRYIGPVRDLHPRTHVASPPPDPRCERDAAQSPHPAPWVDGSAAWTHLHTNPQMVEEVSDWLAQENRLDTGYALRTRSAVTIRDDDIRLVGASLKGRNLPSGEREKLAAAIAAPQREIELVATRNELPVRVADVGVGISQVFPVVVAALDPRRPGITAIEQPELHLHPRVQVELGDLFAQQIGKGGIFLLETHSEHLMLRLLRRIEETHAGELPDGKPPLRPDHVSVVFIEQVDGEVHATRLRIDETGEFTDRWPHGFFDERDDELF